MTGKEFAEKAFSIAENTATVYMKGVFGAPVSEALLVRMKKQYPAWYTEKKLTAFRELLGKAYFGFDCVCFLKAILWGWSGDPRAVYGGAVYKKDGIPDFTVDGMLDLSHGISTDFTGLVPGEVLWMPGHCGIYLGQGMSAECTTSWEGGVQITACNAPLGTLKTRYWKKHARLNFVDYTDCTLPVLKKGDKVPSVLSLQLLLNAKAGEALDPDGSFGGKTVAAVNRWKEARDRLPDGIWTECDWAELIKG